jgi:hypothetical protein
VVHHLTDPTDAGPVSELSPETEPKLSSSQPPPANDLESFDDEQPDYLRLVLLSSVLVILVCALVYTRFINPPKKPFYNDIPGIDLAGLSAEQRNQVLKIANGTLCECGDADCGYNVAECRHRMICDASLKQAGEIVRQVTGRSPVFTTRLAPGTGSMTRPGAGVGPGPATGSSGQPRPTEDGKGRPAAQVSPAG